jgi:thioredoxin 1
MSPETAAAPTEPIQLTDRSDLESAVASYDVVLVDFYADWCGPCQMMEPTIETLASDTDAAILKVDVDRFGGLASEFDVQGIPTLVLFADGEAVDQLVGAQSEAQLRSAIEEHTG